MKENVENSVETSTKLSGSSKKGSKMKTKKGKESKRNETINQTLEISAPMNPSHKLHITEEWEWKNSCAEDFILEKEIGKGAFGIVYKAKHKATGMEFAIKELKADVLKSDDCRMEELRLELTRELDVLRECIHRALVRYYGCLWLENGSLWVLMEYVEPGSLRDVLLTTGVQLNERQIAAIMYTVLEGLAFLHSRNICHFDVKAGNLLLTLNGEVRLCDFGLSRRIDNMNTEEIKSVAGSRLWMAPELLSWPMVHVPGPKADVWSAAITAIEIAQGNPPYWYESTMTAVRYIKENPPPYLGMDSKLAREREDLSDLSSSDGEFEPKPKKKKKHSVPKWSTEFHHFISFALVKDPVTRPSITQLLAHPFILKGKEHCSKKKRPVLYKLLRKWKESTAKQGNSGSSAFKIIRSKGSKVISLSKSRTTQQPELSFKKKLSPEYQSPASSISTKDIHHESEDFPRKRRSISFSGMPSDEGKATTQFPVHLQPSEFKKINLNNEESHKTQGDVKSALITDNSPNKDHHEPSIPSIKNNNKQEPKGSETERLVKNTVLQTSSRGCNCIIS